VLEGGKAAAERLADGESGMTDRLRSEIYQISTEVFKGVNEEKLPKGMRQLLAEHNIDTTNEKSALKELITDPKMLAYAGIVAYSSARAIPAAAVEEFHGSVPALLAIDVGTAIPYTWGMIETFGTAPRSRTRRALGALVAGTTFMAPYAYFAAEGQNYPMYVNWIIGGMIGTAIAKEVVSTKLNRRKEQRLVEGLQKTDLMENVVSIGNTAQPEQPSIITKTTGFAQTA
jgi:hypothetical protein